MQQNDFNHRPPRTWIKIQVKVAAPLAEILASFLGNLSGSGVEYNDCYQPGTQNDISSLSAYLDKDDQCNQKLGSVKLFLENLHKQNPQHGKPEVSSALVVEEDWGNNWKKHFKPINATKRIVIKPSWEQYTPLGEEFIIEIDPGMAFGTGMHASTQLSLKLIDQLFQHQAHKPASALDVGTGTGILGMAAALLGCPKVVGIDNDIDARVVALENIQKNRLDGKMTIVDENPNNIPGTFDLVIANIIHNTLIELAEPLTAKIAANGFLILAGILSGQQTESIKSAFCSLGLSFVKEMQKEEWSAICLANNRSEKS